MWREPFCLTEYLRGRSKITVFKNQLRIRREHFDPLLLGVCFIGTHFLKIHPSFFFSGRVPRTLVNKYALSFRTLPLETGQLEWICCLLGAQCRTFYSVMAWFLIPGGGNPYDGLYGEARPKRGTFFRLQVYERIGILLVEVYEKVGKSVIWASEMAQRAEQMNFMAL